MEYGTANSEFGGEGVAVCPKGLFFLGGCSLQYWGMGVWGHGQGWDAIIYLMTRATFCRAVIM